MKKKILILAVLALVAVVAVLGGIKGLQIDRMIAHGKQMVPPAEAVTSATAVRQSWESVLTAVGSLSAVQGVTLSAELTGKVAQIAFTPGGSVKAGDLLVKQDTSSEEAQLRSAEAGAALARLNIERLGKLLVEKTIAQSQYDNAEAQLKQAKAQADTIRATIAKKTIRAPSAGRLGIRLVNLGQIIKEGEAIVSLQALDPIFVDFSLPQQTLPQMQAGHAGAHDHRRLAGGGGHRHASPPSTPRSMPPPATSAFRPPWPTRTSGCGRGCSSTSRSFCPATRQVLAIPATAVLYAPYSDSVFVVEDQGRPGRRAAGKVVRQQFVRARGAARRFRGRALGPEGGRHGGEHGRVQAAQRPVRGGR